MKIYDLKTNYQKQPLGICLDNLTLSWKTAETRGTFPQWSRVRIAEDKDFKELVYDSGEAQLVSGAFHPDTTVLRPGKPYYWQVQVMDDSGEMGVSRTETFEGGHPDGPWSGSWITAPFGSELHPLFQKTFEVKGEATERARLYICGLGLYEVYLNGQKVGEEYLTPYFTDYRYWIQYQTYDVTPLLKPGRNRLDVWMGNGWYKGKFGYLNRGELRDQFGAEFKLLSDLILTDRDGGCQVVGTDETWLALKCPVCTSGIYDGELCDIRLEKEIEEPPVRKRIFARETDAPEGELLPMYGVGVKRHEVLPVQQILTTDTGETVLDFGQEITGWVCFYCDAPIRQLVTLQYGEAMQKGQLYRDNLRTARAEYSCVSGGQRHFVRPHFTYYGFRYVKVIGMKVDASNVKDFEAWALYSDIGETGWIHTSNEKVNRLIENTKWSQKDNFLDIPTDCPQRDERLGWTGDAQIFCGAACYHMETPAFFRKYMKDMVYEQREKGGAVPYVVPDVLTVGRKRMGELEFDLTEDLWGEAGSSAWGDAAAIIPWNLYRFYGNERLLLEQYDNMKQWVDFIVHMDEAYCGGKRLWTCGFHFGDWLSLDAKGESKEGGTDKYFVASVYYMYSAELTARAAAVLGKPEEQIYYQGIADEVRQALRKEYRTKTGTLRIQTQTAYVLGIHFHIFEEEEMAEAAEHLAKLLSDNKDHLLTGFVGTGYLCQTLCQAGLTEKAYTLLLNEGYPGWLYAVNLGATTIWERWNSIGPDGTVSGTKMNSLNHYAYGAIAQWVYRDVCGLCQAEDSTAFRKVLFSPKTDERMEFAEAEYDSVSGLWKAGWRRDGKRMIYKLTVPFGCSARFVPDGKYGTVTVNGKMVTQTALLEMELVCGTYEFVTE